MISGIRKDLTWTLDVNGQSQVRDKILRQYSKQSKNPFKLPSEFNDVERLAKNGSKKLDTDRFLTHW